MQLQGQNGFGHESLVWHRREKLQDKAKSLGRAENMRPRRPVLFNSSDVTRERASVVDIAGEVPNSQWKWLEQLKRNSDKNIPKSMRAEVCLDHTMGTQ